ncbi:MAG TPA: glycosyltransferase family 39 protein, partial [Candidatus Solibacter sp.]|nr:glycosyltransferase family 39 protein [Candidatus Solibacter sp.]
MPEFLRRNLLPIAVLALAAALRLWALDVRPPHFDEGVNGGFADLIQRNGAYRYDPTKFHGPLHFYVLFLSKCLFGRNLWALRVPVVLVGLATVALLLFPLRRFFSARTCLIAGLAMAVSPAFVYYQRDAIHEAWLVLFLVMAFLGWLGLWQRRTRADLWMLTTGVTGMILTKETYAIHLGCALLAWPCARLWSEAFPVHEPEIDRTCSWDWREIAFAVGCGLATIGFFYSATLFHPEDLRGLYQTFAAWTKTGVADKGHLKPWYYWLKILLRYEWFALFGLVAAFRFVLAEADARLRGLSIYALGVLTAYTIISYKTPWCVISIGWPFLVLGAAWLSEWIDA